MNLFFFYVISNFVLTLGFFFTNGMDILILCGLPQKLAEVCVVHIGVQFLTLHCSFKYFEQCTIVMLIKVCVVYFTI